MQTSATATNDSFTDSTGDTLANELAAWDRLSDEALEQQRTIAALWPVVVIGLLVVGVVVDLRKIAT